MIAGDHGRRRAGLGELTALEQHRGVAQRSTAVRSCEMNRVVVPAR